jgi:molecular chaperone GrpE
MTRPETESETNPKPAESPAEPTAAAVDLSAELEAEKKKYLYLYAEFENFKKRAWAEREETRKFGWENTARELLGVLDNLERALAHMPEGTDKNLAAGIQMIARQFQTSLEKVGVKPQDVLGKPFDPNFHEALLEEKSDAAPGTVLREETKGYTIHGRLLRPARVVIAKS